MVSLFLYATINLNTMLTLMKIRLAQIKYELKNLDLLNRLFLATNLIIVAVMLHAAFSKYPEWTTLVVSFVIMSQHYSRKDAKFIKLNVEKSRRALFFDYLFLFFPFMSIALLTPYWYCFFVILIVMALISCLKFNNEKRPTGLAFLSRIIPSSYFEILSGCRRNYIFWALIVLYCSALGLCWVRSLPLFLLWFMTTAIWAFFGEYEPLNILRKNTKLNSIQFLKEKLKRNMLPLVIIYTPIVILNTLFHPDLGYINWLFLTLQLLSFSFIILNKYATYYPKAYFNTNNPILILVGLCNLIPYLMPIVLFLNVTYYFKAIKNLNNYFQ
jgi:hypothetical protein